MKKIITLVSIGLAAALIIGGAVWGKSYYQNHYVGSDYYAMVPLDYDVTPGMLKDMKGNDAEPGKRYTLTAYNENGEAKVVEFPVKGDDGSKYPQPGAYLKISASKYLVVGWGGIEESKIPALALEKIKEAAGIAEPANPEPANTEPESSNPGSESENTDPELTISDTEPVSLDFAD